MIRRADSADEGALLDLIRAFYELDGHVFDRKTVTEGLAPLLASDRYGTVLVSGERDLEGYAAVVWSYSIESGGPDARCPARRGLCPSTR